MQIAYGFAMRVVGGELHRTDASAAFAFHLTGTADMDVGECFWQWQLLGRYPSGDGAHRTETAPCARCVDERQDDANDGGRENDGPKHASNVTPALGEAQLDTEHRENKKHHKQPETRGAHKLGDGLVGRVPREQTVVHAAARAHVTAPETSSPDGCQYGADHADEGNQSDRWIEPTHDEICEENPVERPSWSLEMTMK